MDYTVNRDVDKSQYSYFRFSDAEYAQRHKKIREFMAERNLDCLLITTQGAVWDRCWANVVYVMNWMGTMEMPGYCVFPKEGAPVVSCLALNAGFPDRVARITVGEARGSSDTVAVAAERVKELGIKKGRIGLVEPDVGIGIPANHLDTLTRELPQVEFVSVTYDWWLMRVEKSPEEIAVLEECAHWGDLTHIALAADIRPGVTERDLFATVYNNAYRLGAEHPSMLLVGTGPMKRPFGNFVRTRPVNRMLQPGDIVTTELGARHPGGYEAQVGHIFTLGPPTQIYQELFGQALEAHHQLCDICRPGNTEQDVWEVMRPFREANHDPRAPITGNWAIIHGMFGIPKDIRQITFEEPEGRNPLLPYQLVTVEIHAATPDRTGQIYLVHPYLVMPEGSPKALSQLPVEITVL